MVAMLSQLVAWESPSLDGDAQLPILDFLSRQLQDLDYHTRLLPSQRCGGHLLARPRLRRKGRGQLLVGHCDTVWPRGTLEGMPVQQRQGKLSGPGCYDMKGGLVQFVFALRALHQLGCQPPFDPFLLVNSDEEVGSFESGRWLHRLAPHMVRCLVAEPSLGPDGKLKTVRKGVASYTVTISGISAHAGLDPGAGASAILELSYLIQQMHALNDAQRGVSVNVGLVQGGLRANVVAPESRAVIDVRVPSQSDAERIDLAIRQLRPHLPGVSWTVEGRMGRPPMEATPGNQALWKRAQQLGAQLGLQLQQGVAGGGSDGSTTSLYCPTLDGLGPVGGGAHAQDEFVLIESLPERTALLALLMMEPEEMQP